jgi:adenosylcobinamide-phosphate synthase
VSRELGLLLGYIADRTVPDPARHHPVAGFGTLATALERRIYAPTRARGAAYTATLVGGAAVIGLLLERRHRLLATVLATWTVLGGASLEREALAVSRLLAEDRLAEARIRLTHLVGRDTSALDEAEVARAVVESVAENTSDAVVAPLVLGALCGVPGLLGYRAANTLDAMVGHRSERYREFGWASARLDDLLNLPGARLSALLATVLGPSPRGALAAWVRDASAHPSPNAGPVEAAFAGALGIRLGGSNRYGEVVEHRAVLGSGRPVEPGDIQRAVDLARRVDVAAVVLVSALVGLRRRSTM